MDNFDQEEVTNSNIKGSHDTVMIIFQNNGKTVTEENYISMLPTNDVFPKIIDLQQICWNAKPYYHLEHLDEKEILQLIISARKTILQIQQPLVHKRISYNGYCVGIPLLHIMLSLYSRIMLQKVC